MTRCNATLGLVVSLGLIAIIPHLAAGQTLIGRYSFNDGTANDSAGSLNGTLSATGAEISGGGLVISSRAVDTGVLLYRPTLFGTPPAFPSASFTIEDWFAPSSVVPDYSTLFSFADIPGEPGSDLLCHLNKPEVPGPGSGFTVEYQLPQSQYFRITLTAPTPAAGLEVCIATTYDATTDVVSMYLNGVLESSSPIPGGFDLDSLFAFPMDGVAGIGGYDQYDDPATPGTHDEFRIYAGALTPAQVANEAADGPNIVSVPEPSLVLWILNTAAVVCVARPRRRRTGLKGR